MYIQPVNTFLSTLAENSIFNNQQDSDTQEIKSSNSAVFTSDASQTSSPAGTTGASQASNNSNGLPSFLNFISTPA